jgi:hypothetical protein
MSRAVRLLGAAALACASVPLVGVGAAHADTASKVPSNSAYFSATGIDKPEASPAEPPNVTSVYADGVGPGHLAVAAKGGTEDKVSFLYYEMLDLEPGTTIDKAVVRLELVPTSKDDISFQASPDKVVACQAGDEGFSGDDGKAIATSSPSRLCDKFSAKGVLSKDSLAYEFDITGLASTWIEGANEGVAFTVADAAQSSNFQVVFGSAETAKLSLTYTPPAPTTPPVVAPPVVMPPAGGTLPDLGTGVVPGSGFVPAPDLGTQVPTPTVNEAPLPQTDLAQAPTRNVAAVTMSMRPTTGFWLAGLGLAGVLALLSLILGDSSVPAAARSRSRLSLALASPQRLGGGAGLRAHSA